MTLRLVARPNGLLIPVSDLNLKDLPSRDLIVGDDLPLVLANLLGFDGNQPRLLRVDAAGNLKLAPGGLGTGVAIVDGSPVLGAVVTAFYTDVGNTGRMLQTQAFMNLNQAAGDNPMWRAGSAGYLSAQSSRGAGMVSSPGEWTVNSQPAAGSQATATRAAGGAGVRHICRSIMFSAGSIVAPALGSFVVNVRDGASGAGAILLGFQLIVLAAVGQNVPPFAIPGLNLVGSANTAMTVEWTGGTPNLLEQVGFSGYDAT